MSSSRTTSCISSSRSLYRSFSVTSWSCHREKGWVPAEASRRPDRDRISDSVDRKRMISSRASWTLAQTFVPTSTTDCIISGFTSSPRVGPAASSTASM
jgi:hypothetical protein